MIKISNTFLLIFVFGLVSFAQKTTIKKNDTQIKIDSLVKLILIAKEDTAKIHKLNSLTKEYNTISDFDKSIETSNQSIALSKKINYLKGEADGKFNLADTYRRKKNFDEALKILTDAQAIYEKINSNRGKAECLTTHGLIQSGLGKTDLAMEFYDKAVKFCIANKEEEVLAKTYNNIGLHYYKIAKFTESIIYYEKAKVIKIKLNDKKGAGISFNNLANVYINLGKYNEALESAQEALKLFIQVGFKDGISSTYNNIGLINDNLGNYDKSIEYYQKALKVNELLNDKSRIAENFNNIATTLARLNKLTDALNYYLKALEKRKEVADKFGIGNTLNNIGIIYRELFKKDNKSTDNLKKANDYFEEAVKESEEINSPMLLSEALHNLGDVKKEMGEFQKAIEFYNKALEIREKINYKGGIASTVQKIGETYIKLNEYALAKTYIERSLNLANEMKEKETRFQNYQFLSLIYKNLKMYPEALDFFEKYSYLKDTVLNETTQKVVNELQTKYQTEKKEQQIKQLDLQQNLNESQIKQQKTIIWVFVTGFILILVFSVIITKQFRDKRKANIQLAQQKEEISTQRDEIEKQKDIAETQLDLITEQKREIDDSIRYAQRIQHAVLPQLDTNAIPQVKDMFIMFRPKDVVSGDFYFMRYMPASNVIIAAAADCTGHGVPGAFMSMLGVTFINEICAKPEVQHASDVLNMLRLYIINSLHQTGKMGEQKDGMDISLVTINLNNRTLEYSGANNPLYLIRNNELIEYKADKMPVGIHDRCNESFNNHVIPYKENDIIYLFSDGFADQFGGVKGKKYLYKKYKEFLLSIHTNNLSDQGELIRKEAKEWQGELEQVDDQLVMGIKL